MAELRTNPAEQGPGEQQRHTAPDFTPLQFLTARVSLLHPDHSDIDSQIEAAREKITDHCNAISVFKQTERNLNEVYDRAYPAATSQNPSLHRALQRINRTLNIANTQTGLVGRHGSPWGIGFRACAISLAGGAIAGSILLATSSTRLDTAIGYSIVLGVTQLMCICMSSLARMTKQGTQDEPFIDGYYSRKGLGSTSMMRSGEFLDAWALAPAIVAGVPLQILKTITIDALRAHRKRGETTPEMKKLETYLALYAKDAALPAQAAISKTVLSLYDVALENARAKESIGYENQQIYNLKTIRAAIKKFPNILSGRLDSAADKIGRTLVRDLYGAQFDRISKTIVEDPLTHEQSSIDDIAERSTLLEHIAELPAELSKNRELLGKLLTLAAHSDEYQKFKEEQLSPTLDISHSLDLSASAKSLVDINERYRQYCAKVFEVIDEIMEDSITRSEALEPDNDKPGK